jgi:tetratricopeptide (TPR) repeat protein
MNPTYTTWQRWLLCLALALASWATYAGVSGHSFLSYDDPAYVTQNRQVLAGLTRSSVAWAFTAVHSGNWHPLTWLSHMLDVELFGLDAGAHHLTNLALHVANALLLFGVLARMTGATGRSAFVAGLFALHPLHVESVAWVSERKDLLSTCFALLALAAWLGWARRRSGVAYAGALALFALGLMAKPMLVTLPFLLLLLDLWPLGRLATRRPLGLAPLLVEKLPFFALSAASSLVTLGAQSSAISLEVPLGVRLSNALVGYLHYLGRALWPSELAAFYPYPYPEPWPLALVACAAALLIGVSAAALLRLRRQPYLAVGWLWFLGMLVPVIGLVQVGLQSMADRYMYLPLVGLAVPAVWGAHEALARLGYRDALLAGVGIALLAACALATRVQVGYWRDSETLFRRALAVTDGNYYAHVIVGSALFDRGELEAAIEHFEESLRDAPWYSRAHANLGRGLLARGDLEGALASLSQASRLNPWLRHAHFHRGEALERARRHAEAVEAYRAELELSPDHSDARRRLATLLATHPSPELRDPEEAVRLAARLCEHSHYREPGDLDVLAAALASAGRFEEAVQTATRALELARAASLPKLSGGIEARLELYRDRRPVRMALDSG